MSNMQNNGQQDKQNWDHSKKPLQNDQSQQGQQDKQDQKNINQQDDSEAQPS